VTLFILALLTYRFLSVQELQSLLVELMENFEFSLPDGGIDVMRVPVGTMIPILRDEMAKGAQMPLQIKCLTA
jgi:hypothetical protein